MRQLSANESVWPDVQSLNNDGQLVIAPKMARKHDTLGWKRSCEWAKLAVKEHG